ncbi:unnamed protein product [Durusdinium trenchii]|uniref:Centrosomal protein POC5 n=1 Tax=Durusdinium trenchii TaxID=1381693 RepID=A0ABP0J267_9DINO
MLSDDADLCDEVLHTVARAFRAWQQALVQAKKIRLESAEPQEPQAPRAEPRASVAKLLGSEGYRQLGVGRRSFRSPRLSQEAPVEAEVGRTTEIESSPQAEQIEAASSTYEAVPDKHAQPSLDIQPEEVAPKARPPDAEDPGPEQAVLPNEASQFSSLEPHEDHGAAPASPETPSPSSPVFAVIEDSPKRRPGPTMSDDCSWYVLGGEEPPLRASDGVSWHQRARAGPSALLLAETRLRQGQRKLVALCLTAWREGLGFATCTSLWEDDEEDMQRWHLRGLELRLEESQSLREKEQKESAKAEATLKERLNSEFQAELQSQAVEAERHRQMMEAGFLERLLGAERERDNLQAQINYAVYDAQREKDLMEARLRGELDDAHHQQEVQQAKTFAIEQDAQRMREIDQAKLSAVLHDELRLRDVREAKMVEDVRRQQAAAQQSNAALGDQLRHERAEREEEKRRFAVLQQQLDAAKAELVKEHARAFDLKAALDNLKTVQELRDAEEKSRMEAEESRQALLQHVQEVEDHRARLQAEVDEMQAGYISLKAEAAAEQSKAKIAEQTLKERDVRVAQLLEEIQKHRSQQNLLKDEAAELADHRAWLGEDQRWLLTLETRLKEEQKKASELEDQLLKERVRCARRLEDMSEEILQEKAKRLELQKPGPPERERQQKEAKFLAELNESKRQTRAFERGWKQAVLDAKDLETLLEKERQQRKLLSDFVEDLERRCFSVHKDLRLEHLPEMLADERQHLAQMTQTALNFEDRCEKLQKVVSDLQIYTEKLSIESANGAVAARRASDLEEKYNELSLHADFLEQELRRNKKTVVILDDSCAGLEQKLANQRDNAVEVLAGRSKARLRCVGLRCLSAWRQWLIMEQAQKWREAEATKILEASDAYALRLQGRTSNALHNVGTALFHQQWQTLMVHVFLSWRLHCKVETSDDWRRHQEQITSTGRDQVLKNLLETALQESALLDDDEEEPSSAMALQIPSSPLGPSGPTRSDPSGPGASVPSEKAVSKAERVAEAVAEKMHRQLCEELLKETFSIWHQDYQSEAAKKKEELERIAKKNYEEEKQRLQAEKEAEAAKAREAREAHEAEIHVHQEAWEQSPEEPVDMQRLREAEREALQRQQQLAAAEREALVEQIKAARRQQSFEMEILKEQVARAEDARRSQQEELERLKEEVTKGSVYQEILQHFKIAPVASQGVLDSTVGPQTVVGAPSQVSAKTVATRSVSVEAVPAIPRHQASIRPNLCGMELGRKQAELLERMLMKAVLQGWQSILGGYRPFEPRVRDVPWQTPPEEPLLARPRGQNWAMAAELATQGLDKWSESSHDSLTAADLYEACARAHATFASWAVSSSRRQMSTSPVVAASAEEEAAEQAVQRAHESISKDVMEELEQAAMQPASSWPPPLLPPRPILPGDRGWDDRVRLASGPKRRLFGPEDDHTTEEVLVVQSDGYLTSFHPVPRESQGVQKPSKDLLDTED